MEATDRLAVRTTVVVVRRLDAAIAAEVQVARVFAIWSTRPIEADAAGIVQRPIEGVAITRSRVPDGECTAKIAGEVYTFSTVVISVRIR